MLSTVRDSAFRVNDRAHDTGAFFNREAIAEVRWLQDHLLERHRITAASPVGRSLQRLMLLLNQAGMASEKHDGTEAITGFALVDRSQVGNPQVVQFCHSEWQAVDAYREASQPTSPSAPLSIIPATVRLGIPS